jgi:hypothetical protein
MLANTPFWHKAADKKEKTSNTKIRFSAYKKRAA